MEPPKPFSLSELMDPRLAKEAMRELGVQQVPGMQTAAESGARGAQGGPLGLLGDHTTELERQRQAVAAVDCDVQVGLAWLAPQMLVSSGAARQSRSGPRLKPKTMALSGLPAFGRMPVFGPSGAERADICVSSRQLR